ncbi:MAG TPA: RagB/SusD family nutrient uptake outer membrane protein [Bacteroidales bacterium]|nr:RagB/SusD family nutrient uptake outer membrane protein [Bacteroidales bacterium]HPT20368.1 RagB/SusD family nutrient uptake outer membrane protein [Bacteroidales bacterium]
MKKIIYIILGMFLITACSEDILNLDNPNQYSADTYYKNLGECEKGVNAIYGGFYHDGLYAREYYFIFDLLANEAEQNSPMEAPTTDWPNYTHNPSNAELQGLWRSLYRIIFRSNIAIYNIGKWETLTDEDSARKETLLGEAYFLKGWAYFELVNIWGRVPIRTWENSTVAEVPRSSVEDVWNVVESDLSEAINRLPVVWEGENIGRATKGAAVALMGKSYLYEKKYAEAHAELALLAQAPYSYALHPDYMDEFLESGDNSEESVFEVQFKGGAVSDAVWYMFGGQESWGLGGLHTGRSTEYGFNDWENCHVSDAAAAAFKYKDESNADYIDPRASMVFYGAPAAGGDTTYAGGAYPYEDKGFMWKKYQTYETNTNENDPNSGINARVIRYADVLLMRAEALIMDNKTDEALPLINDVRRRVNAFEYTSLGNQDEAIKKIKLERRLELCGEQVRWFDLIRWGEAMKVINEEKMAAKGVAPFLPKHVLFCIPQEEKDANPLVAGDIQNDWN